jgi:hypothetical protein
MQTNVNRTTVDVHLRVRAEVKERAEADAKTYGLPVSAYVGDLIMDREPKPKIGVDLGPLVLLGQRVVATLNTLPTIPENESARAALTDLRRAVADALLALRLQYYDEPLNARRAEDWRG